MLSLALALALAAGAPHHAAPSAAARPGRAPTAAEAKAFVDRVDVELRRLLVRQAAADWVSQTYITGDTQQLNAWLSEELQAYVGRVIAEAQRFRNVKGLDPQTARALYLISISNGNPIPAPSDPGRRAELARLMAGLQAAYGKGKWCGPDGKAPCRDIDALTETMRRSRSWDELTDAWVGWHAVGAPMRTDYARLVELANEGAREIGYPDVGALWRAGYDMTPAQFEADVDRLWGQLRPLYVDLHCYVRGKLQEVYGRERVPDGQPIPAQLLGNLWAQEWANVFPVVAPRAASAAAVDVEGAMVARGLDAVKMVKVGEGFYTSLGLDPLPATFWERSMLVRPRDRDVVCHASAWDLTWNDDLRVKMCIRVNEDDLRTIHHELGHDYYFHAYHRLPVLFQLGANDGFHEAIGDAIALSVTPGYLKAIGILDAAPPESPDALVAQQLRVALDKIAFAPFARMVDQWRWDVFAGKVKPAGYEAAWNALRLKYQGVAPPVARSEADFDPGAKMHVATSTPYTRYFLALVYQFQFHRALCRAAGHQGPLHTCSIHGSQEAGKRLQAMMALGASRPWPEAMEALTGQREADATAILEYFQPLQSWLKEQNRGRTCGW